jgi:hypothetical protein
MPVILLLRLYIRSPQGRHGSFVDKEHLKLLKAKVSAKLRQHHVLERIKAKAIEEIKRYVSESLTSKQGYYIQATSALKLLVFEWLESVSAIPVPGE